MEENGENGIECLFCGEKSVFISLSSGLGRIYIATCDFCGARGQSYLHSKDAELEWKSLLESLYNEKRLISRHKKIRCPECGEWMGYDEDDFSYRCHNVMCDLSSDY